jgi:MFS family permease
MYLQQDQTKRLELLAVLGIIGAAFFAVALVALHFLEPEYNNTPAMSQYALGRYGGLMVAAFCVLGVGYLALAFGLRSATVALGAARLGSILLGLAGFWFVVSGVFRVHAPGTPMTFSGVMHGLGFIVGVPTLIASILVLSGAFGRDDRWRSFRPVSSALGLAALILFLIAFFAPGIPGTAVVILSRVFVGTFVLWLLLTALRLRSIAKGASAQQPTRVR